MQILGRRSNEIHQFIRAHFFCSISTFFPFICRAEIVEFFFVDTTPFEDKYFDHPEDDTYDWRGVVPREKYLSSLLKVS